MSTNFKFLVTPALDLPSMSPLGRTAGSSRISVCFRALLLLAIWTGPLPYCHCHGTLFDSENPGSSWLLNHLQSFHADASLFADVDFGWHLHFSSPGDSEEEDSPQARWLSFAGTTTAVSACLQDLRSLVPLTIAAAASTSGKVMPATYAAGPFLTNFAPSLPVPLRLGVIRC